MNRYGPAEAPGGFLYCHACGELEPTTRDADGFYACRACWNLIRCDECGREWTGVCTHGSQTTVEVSS